MTRRLGLVAPLIWMIAGFAFAGGCGEDEMAPEGMEIDWNTLEVGMELTVTGELGVYGSEPHTYLAVAVEDLESPSGIRLVQVEGEHFDELSKLQGQTVTVTGTINQMEIGPGFPAVMEVQEFLLEAEE